MKLQRQEGDINFLFQASINQDVNVDFEPKLGDKLSVQPATEQSKHQGVTKC